MNVHGPALNLQTKLTGGRFCLTTRFMYTALLNITCPRRNQTDNAVWGGKEVVRYLVVSIYLSMLYPYYYLSMLTSLVEIPILLQPPRQ